MLTYARAQIAKTMGLDVNTVHDAIEDEDDGTDDAVHAVRDTTHKFTCFTSTNAVHAVRDTTDKLRCMQCDALHAVRDITHKFTCFTSTKVQILTQKELQVDAAADTTDKDENDAAHAAAPSHILTHADAC